MKVTRPVLIALNGAANWCLHRVGVEPVDELSSGRNPETLRVLVDHSAEAGALDHDRRNQLLSALDLDTAQLSTLLRPHVDVAGVKVSDRAEEIRDMVRHTGHLRLVVWRDQEPVGVVHVRDTLGIDASTTAADIMRPVLILPPDAAVHQALTTMRRQRSQFTLVKSGEGQLLGLVTMQDLLDRLLPST